MLASRPFPSSSWLAAIQGAVVLAVLVALAFAPPAQGRMLLLPPSPSTRVAALAIDHGALLVSAGPTGGSVVVIGDRDRLARPLMAAGVLLLAAPPAGCGTPGERPADA